jgi:cytochrome c2
MQAALDELPQGDSQAGEQIFSETGGCSACHSLEPGERKVGPSLAGIARSTALPADYSPEMYIYEAITSPASFVVAGYPANVMPEGYGRRLSKQELADLLAFLMTK